MFVVQIKFWRQIVLVARERSSQCSDPPPAFPLHRFSMLTRRQVAHTARHRKHHITTWSPDGERRRLTSDTPRYLRRRLIAASTRTSRPAPLAFKQNSEADEKLSVCKGATVASVAGVLGCPGFLPQPIKDTQH